MSGSKDSRPAFNEMLDQVRKGKIQVVIVHALDRLGRSLPHLVKIITEFVDRNITLVSYRENIDLSSSSGRFIAGVLSLLSDYELSNLKSRTKAGIRAARARGKQIGNPKRFFDKKKATTLRDKGYGQIRIAKELKIGVGRVNDWAKHEYVPPEQCKKNGKAILREHNE